MAPFRFVHAADLHIDSPLLGLASRSAEFAARIDEASRQAFDNLVSLAKEEECRFVLLAGDLFDGQWRDFRTGLFFADRMRRLKETDITVFIVLGNHDAENTFMRRLELADNVRVLSRREPETVRLDDLGVAIHGRSFPQRDVAENFARNYPAPIAGLFNIGLLHTACDGREGHALYAPCSVEDLVNRGYDYWALGHVHAHEMVCRDPYIVFPGNLQGRHVRETGPKGAMLVTVDGNRVVEAVHRALDVIRWSVATVDISACTDMDEVRSRARETLLRAADAADGRGLALHLRVCGPAALHDEIVAQEVAFGEEIQTIAAAASDRIWIEKVEIDTAPPHQAAPDPTISGRIQAIVEELRSDPTFAEILDRTLGELRQKLPAGARAGEFLAGIRNEALARAARLSAALIVGAKE